MHIEKQKQSGYRAINLTVKKSTIWAFLSILFYKIVLDLSYYFLISPVWSYSKFTLDINVIKLTESYLLLFVIFILMPKSSKKLSSIMIWLLILLSYIPMLTLFALKDESRIFMYAVAGFWILVFLLLKIPSISISFLKKSQAKFTRGVIFVSLVAIVFFLINRYLGISFNFDLTKVYDIRSQYLETGIPWAGYLFTWLAYIVNPVFFAICITRKRWIYAVLIAVLQLLVFSSTGNKTFLFILPFVLVLMWIVTRKNPLAWMAIGLVGIILLGMLSYWLIDDIWMSSLFARRTLLVPAQLSFLYHDFFSKHDYVFLSPHRIFRFFLDYPYHLDPPHLIGEVYFNQPKMGANTGIVGDAYMNFGFVGFALWGILLAIILRMVDSCSRGKDIKIAIVAIAMPVIVLTNSALLTCLLTHGLLLALFLLYLLPKEEMSTI